MAYHLFYRLLRVIAKIAIPLDAGDFCVMRHEVVCAINALPERNRFLRGLRAWFGVRQVAVPYDRNERGGSHPKYTWGKLLQLSLDGLISFSDLPLRMTSFLGFIVSTGSFVGIRVRQEITALFGRGDFGPGQGAKSEHTRWYVSDKQRSPETKAPGEIDAVIS